MFTTHTHSHLARKGNEKTTIQLFVFVLKANEAVLIQFGLAQFVLHTQSTSSLNFNCHSAPENSEHAETQQFSCDRYYVVVWHVLVHPSLFGIVCMCSKINCMTKVHNTYFHQNRTVWHVRCDLCTLSGDGRIWWNVLFEPKAKNCELYGICGCNTIFFMIDMHGMQVVWYLTTFFSFVWITTAIFEFRFTVVRKVGLGLNEVTGDVLK